MQKSHSMDCDVNTVSFKQTVNNYNYWSKADRYIKMVECREYVGNINMTL